MDIVKQTDYNWKHKYDDMDVSDSKRFKQFEDEDRKHKELVVEQALDDTIL